jgi:hypothetical protein
MYTQCVQSCQHVFWDVVAMNEWQKRALAAKRQREREQAAPVGAGTMSMIAHKMGEIEGEAARRDFLVKLLNKGMIDERGYAHCVRAFCV